MYSADPLLSLTENPEYFSSQTDTPPVKSHFKLKRAFIFAVIALSDMLIFFQRACPTVVTEDLAKAYNVPVSKLGIFSSTFFYPYLFLQPFAGLLADVMEPAFLIGVSNVLSAIGDLVCGLSTSLALGCISRIIMGIGGSLVYSSCQRIIMNWFPLENYSKILGLFLFLAGCGTLLAQTPFALLSMIIGWRWCFYSIAILSLLLSILLICFVRGNPIAHGYPPVNKSLSINIVELSFREKGKHLLHSLKTIVTTPTFYLFSIFVFVINGAFGNITGIWGGPYLKEVLGYNSIKASNALLGLSIGSIVGPIINSFLIDVLNYPRLIVFIETFIALGCCIPLAFFPDKLNFPIVISILVVFSLTTHTGTITIPYCLEHFHPTSRSSVIGCLNCFASISLVILMPLTGMILEHFGTMPNNPDLHNPDGFKYGIWVINIAGLALNLILILFVKKPVKEISNPASSYKEVQ